MSDYDPILVDLSAIERDRDLPPDEPYFHGGPDDWGFDDPLDDERGEDET